MLRSNGAILDILRLQMLLQVFLTAYLELVMLGGLSKGQSVLIHAGAGGVGAPPPRGGGGGGGGGCVCVCV